MKTKNNKITCFIPAKGTSQRLAGKNLRMCDGHPLVAHAYMIARESGVFSDIVVSTDSEKVYDAVHRYGYTSVYRRPGFLSEPESDVWDAVRHFLKDAEHKYHQEPTEYVCILQPTSPCIMPETVRRAAEYLYRSPTNALISVKITDRFTWEAGENPNFKNAKRTQDYVSRYALSSGLYIMPWNLILRHVSIYDIPWVAYRVHKHEEIDIDTLADLQIAEAIIQWRNRNGKTGKPSARDLGSVYERNNGSEGREPATSPPDDRR